VTFHHKSGRVGREDERPGTVPYFDGRWATRGMHPVVEAVVDAWGQISGEDLTVFVQYPVADTEAPTPVVVLCHDLGGSHRGYAVLGSYLASHGYAVLHPQFRDAFDLVAPNLGLTGLDSDSWPNDDHARSMMHTLLFDPVHWVSRVERVHLVLDSLGEQRHLPVALRPEGAIVVGHSFGAYTAQLLVGTRLFGVGLDEAVFTHRAVVAAVLMSPQGSGSRGLTPDSWDGVHAPLLVITATNDFGALGEGLAWRREPYDRARSTCKHLAIVRGGNHSLGGIARSDAAAIGRDAKVQRALSALVTAFANCVHGDSRSADWLASGPFGEIFDHEDAAFQP